MKGSIQNQAYILDQVTKKEPSNLQFTSPRDLHMKVFHNKMPKSLEILMFVCERCQTMLWRNKDWLFKFISLVCCCLRSRQYSLVIHQNISDFKSKSASDGIWNQVFHILSQWVNRITKELLLHARVTHSSYPRPQHTCNSMVRYINWYFYCVCYMNITFLMK